MHLLSGDYGLAGHRPRSAGGGGEGEAVHFRSDSEQSGDRTGRWAAESSCPDPGVARAKNRSLRSRLGNARLFRLIRRRWAEGLDVLLLRNIRQNERRLAGTQELQVLANLQFLFRGAFGEFLDPVAAVLDLRLQICVFFFQSADFAPLLLERGNPLGSAQCDVTVCGDQRKSNEKYDTAGGNRESQDISPYVRYNPVLLKGPEEEPKKIR